MLVQFRGRFEYRMDAKGRLPLPPRYREELKVGVVLVLSPDGCVEVHPATRWDETMGTLLGSHSAQEARTLERYFYANSYEAELDTAGRITVPGALRDRIGLTEGAVVNGARTRLEIWEPGAWERQSRQLAEEAARLVGGLDAE